MSNFTSHEKHTEIQFSLNFPDFSSLSRSGPFFTAGCSTWAVMPAEPDEKGVGGAYENQPLCPLGEDEDSNRFISTEGQ